jgi:hypothetical protein
VEFFVEFDGQPMVLHFHPSFGIQFVLLQFTHQLREVSRISKSLSLGNLHQFGHAEFA